MESSLRDLEKVEAIHSSPFGLLHYVRNDNVLNLAIKPRYVEQVEFLLSFMIIQPLTRRDYVTTWQAMRDFTDNRTPDTPNEIWLVEHPPVYTLGQAGKPEHILNPGNIPIIKTDRGGQVTYHGPGQLVVYPLLDIRRLNLGVRELVCLLEKAVIALLNDYNIIATARRDAPGVYVNGAKISSIGLRIRRGCSYHGLALNIAMDLTPFAGINPCGYENLKMTQLSELSEHNDIFLVATQLTHQLTRALGTVGYKNLAACIAS
jgi:lipoyl(octanoyl) transferase